MKILYLSGNFPKVNLLYAGRVRIFNFLKELSKKNNVDFFCFSAERIPNNEIKSLARYCNSIVLVPHPLRSLKRLFVGAFINIFLSIPLTVQLDHNSIFLNKLQKQMNLKKYDVVIFDSFHLANYIKYVNPAYKFVSVLDFHNVESEFWHRLAKETLNPFKKLILYWQAGKIREFENKVVFNFDLCTTVSERDKNILRASSGCKSIISIRNGVDIKKYKPYISTKKQYILYVGNLDYIANIMAIKYLICSIMPKLNKVCPNIKLKIVGHSEKTKLKFENTRTIKVYQNVGDIRPYYKNALALIIPVKVAGGTRIKIREAMAMKVPVISSSIGAEGFNYVDGKNILIADSAEKFVAQICKLKKSDLLFRNLQKNAYSLVAKEYNWEKIVEDFNKILQALVDEKI